MSSSARTLLCMATASVFAFGCAEASDPQVPAPVAPRIAASPTASEEASAASSTSAVVAEAPSLAPVPECTGTAVVFVLDRSGSMTGLPLEMAKKGAVATIEALGRDDCFGLITFDSAPSRVVGLTLLGDPSPIKDAIARVVAGGGTEMSAALALGRRDLSAAPRAKRRAIILLTDGQSPTNGLRDLAKGLADEGATLTTIGLGTGVDRVLLAELAKVGNGRLYEIADPNNLPKLMGREVTLLRAAK